MNNKPDIGTLLSDADTNGAIIALDNYICELCSWGDELGRLLEPARNFFFNQNLEREINNGGFNQYFYNSAGDNAHETIASLEAIGAGRTAAILQSAIDQFLKSTVPKDREERQQVLAAIEGQANEIWDTLDQAFFAYEENLNELNLKYVKKHQSSFE